MTKTIITTMTSTIVSTATAQANVLVHASALLLAILALAGCESYARMAPPPPSPSFTNVSLNTLTAPAVAWQEADASQIEPAAGAAVSLAEANTTRRADPFSRRECISLGFKNGEAVSYNWDNSRLGLAVDRVDYSDQPDASNAGGQALMRYTIALQPTRPSCD